MEDVKMHLAVDVAVVIYWENISMNTKRLTESQCIRIIANSYLGSPDKKGRQFDYHDYKDDIDRRLWELQEKKHSKIFKSQDKALKEFLDSDVTYDLRDEVKPLRSAINASNSVFQRPFKLGIRWDIISVNCQEALC